ncbi:MAG: TraR/DksA family transcriptional regulator [Candidatus Babeliales bacterium]
MVKGINLEAVKAQLTARKRELEQELTILSTEKFSLETGGDVGDQALSSTMESLRTSLQSTEHQEYDRVIKALGMIERGTYGICSECGEQIAEKRLKYFPDAGRCLVCQERIEGTI